MRPVLVISGEHKRREDMPDWQLVFSLQKWKNAPTSHPDRRGLAVVFVPDLFSRTHQRRSPREGTMRTNPHTEGPGHSRRVTLLMIIQNTFASMTYKTYSLQPGRETTFYLTYF